MLMIDRLTIAEHFVWIGFASAVAGVFGTRLWYNRKTENVGLKRILMGVVLVALGTILIRGFWLTWRVVRATEDWTAANHVLTVANYATTPALILVAFGYSLHIYTWLENVGRCRKCWWLALTTFTLVLYWLGFYLPTFIHHLMG